MIFRTHKHLRPGVKKRLLSHLIAFAIFSPLMAQAASEKKTVSFSRGFMNFYNSGIDLNQFDGTEKVLPGEYKLEVYGNNKKIDSWPVKFIAANNEQGVNACITPEMIIRMDVDTHKLPENWKATSCLILPELISGATVTYVQDEEVLNVTIPQAMLLNTPDGYISPELWDTGEPALMTAYTLSASNIHNRTLQDSTDYVYGNLQSALTMGAWRFVTYDTANMGSGNNNEGFKHLQAYAARAIGSIASEVTMGDLSTSGEFFDTASLRGVRLATDDRMLPDSVRSYAPVVRGVANSNATVTIRQAGNTIYEKVVPPGEFIINDLYATGYNGDLDVSVKETNGKETTFTVPYSSVPQLLREGFSRYSLASGEIRDTWLHEDPWMMEGTLQYGLLNNLTAYAGAQSAFEGDFNALMAGFAVNTSLGALGIDVTRSFTHFEHQPSVQDCGTFCDMSLRISLAKNLPNTGTNFSLIGYRYSSKNYYSLSDAVALKQALEAGESRYFPERYRERVEANINQMLPSGWGSFYVSGFVGNVWNDELGRTEKSNFVVGYNNQLGSATWGVSFGRTNDADGGYEDTVYLNVSMPLGPRYKKRPRMGANFSYNSDEATFRTSLNGSAGERSQFGFGGYFSQSSAPESNFGMNLSYTGDSASGGVAYSQTRDSFMGGVNLSGGMVAHRGGLNFVPMLSDTIGIVEARGAEGSRVYPDSNTVIKDNGYGIISYLNPYKYNEVYIDPKGTAMSVDVEDTRKKIVPTAGSAVLIKMDTQQNKLTFVQFLQRSAETIPFGASVTDEKGNDLGMVGQNGLAMVALKNGVNSLTLAWKQQKETKRCVATVQHDASVNAGTSKAGKDAFSAQKIICTIPGGKQ